jgi:hypothetical protein
MSKIKSKILLAPQFSPPQYLSQKLMLSLECVTKGTCFFRLLQAHANMHRSPQRWWCPTPPLLVYAENADHQLLLAGGSSSYHSAKTEDSESFLYLLRHHVPFILLLEAATLYFLVEICWRIPLSAKPTLSCCSISAKLCCSLICWEIKDSVVHIFYFSPIHDSEAAE